MDKRTSNRNLVDSFERAITGVVYCLRTQRNFRLHFFAAVLSLFSSVWFHLTKAELLLVFMAITFVWVTEIINTAIEVTIDLVTKRKYHPLAAIAKDVSAGGVLVAAANAVVVGYMVFFPKITPSIPLVIEKIRNSSAHLTAITLGFLVFLVITLKIITGRGRPFSGGMPSGHSALGFSLATAVIFITSNGLVAILVLLLSLLVAQSRVESGIHSITEVVVGAALGILFTILIFQLYKQLG